MTEEESKDGAQPTTQVKTILKTDAEGEEIAVRVAAPTSLV